MSTICNSNGVYFTLGSFDNYNNNSNDKRIDNNTESLQEQTKLQKKRKRMLWATNDTQDTSIFACIWDLLELNNII